MHVWTHRRFHDATEGKYWRYWLDVRSKIIDLIVQEGRTVTLDEWLQLDAAQKVAAGLGFTMTWEKTGDGLIIGMGRSNDNTKSVSIEGRRNRG